MTTYSLKQISASAWNICSRGKKVGYVSVVPNGYAAHIRQHCEVANTATAAFQRCAAKALGYETPNALAAHNAAVRRSNATMKSEVRHALNELYGNNTKPFLDLIKRM